MPKHRVRTWIAPDSSDAGSRWRTISQSFRRSPLWQIRAVNECGRLTRSQLPKLYTSTGLPRPQSIGGKGWIREENSGAWLGDFTPPGLEDELHDASEP